MFEGRHDISMLPLKINRRKALHSGPPDFPMYGLKVQRRPFTVAPMLHPPPAQTAARGQGGYPLTSSRLPLNRHRPAVSRRPEASLLFKQARPDFLPGSDFIRVALVLRHAMVQLLALHVRQREVIALRGSPKVRRAIQIFPPPTGCRFHFVSCSLHRPSEFIVHESEEGSGSEARCEECLAAASPGLRCGARDCGRDGHR